MNTNIKVDKTCATCACFFKERNPLDNSKTQTVCRLNPAMLAQAEVKQPAIDARNGQPLFERDGKTLRTEMVVRQFFVYPPMGAELTCWQWRPIGIEPGGKWNEEVDAMMENLFALLQPLLESQGIFLKKPPMNG